MSPIAKQVARKPLARKQAVPPKSIDEGAPPLVIPFEGFTNGAFRYLHALKKNNNKAWFEAHRDQYESELRDPCRALVQAMDILFKKNGMHFLANLKTSLFRINRDIRFSKDKSPYKTHIGMSFPIVGATKAFEAGLYVGFEPKGAKDIHGFVGGGVYMPMPEQLKRIRKKISGDFKGFNKLVSDKTFRKEFPKGLTGESLKRMPLGYSEDDPATEYLKMKQFLFGDTLQLHDLLDEDLPEKLLKKFKAAQAVTLFLGS